MYIDDDDLVVDCTVVVYMILVNIVTTSTSNTW